MRAKLTMGDGIVVSHGEHYDFPEYHDLQRALVPVVSTVDPGESNRTGTFRVGPRTLYGMGTAVCIGAGWFLTAKHVVEPFDRVHVASDDELMFVILETDTALQSGDNDFLGGMLPVRGYSLHPDTDLATLTAELPGPVTDEIRKLTLSLRMPAVGEPVVAAGYPVMHAQGDLPGDGPGSIGWDRTLRASVGVVLEEHPDRHDGWYHPGPAFTTDAPAFSGMSGGPVLDGDNLVVGFISSSLPPTDDCPSWTSHVVLLGPALELSVLDLQSGTNVDAEAAAELGLSDLVAQRVVECEMYPTCDVDPSTGKVIYRHSAT